MLFGRSRSWLMVVLAVSCTTAERRADPPPAAARAEQADDGPRHPPARLQLTLDGPDEAWREPLAEQLAAGRERVEVFFARPFPGDILVTIHPDRAAFTASFPAEWGLTTTECWMVAYGVADGLSALSPRVWDRQACEHDGDDPRHVAQILTHELTHVFHGQHNPTRDFTGAEQVGWFAEGLAVLVAGQLDTDHRDDAAQALSGGEGPVALESAWSGRWRYGVCGSLVAHLDGIVGREQLFALLAATTNAEILAAAGTDEQGLLADWAQAVRSADSDD